MPDRLAVRMRVDALVLDPRAQPRAEIDYALVAEYREDMERGDGFPPVVAWGTIERAYLSSGWHRFKATQQRGQDEIDVDLRDGGLEEAIWHSLSTNGEHGKRRTNADKGRAVRHALELRPSLSDRQVAEHCAVSARFVGTVRSTSNVNGSHSRERLCADGSVRTYETKSIGPSPLAAPPVVTPSLLSDEPTEADAAAAVEQIEEEDHDGLIARHRLRVQFSHAMRAARELVMLRPDAVADVLTTDQQPTVEAFCTDVRAWCESLDAAIRRPLRVVGGRHVTEG